MYFRWNKHSLNIFWTLFVPALTLHVVVKAVFVSKTLTTLAGLCAFFMGTATLLTHPVVGLQLLAFFYLGKYVTKIGKKEKNVLEEDFSEKRDMWQVLANGSVPTLLCCLSHLFIQPKLDQLGQAFDLRTDLNCYAGNCADHRYYFVLTASLASFSACLGDTFSSELGILSPTKPRLITNLSKTVPRGTNGGVTLNGLLAAALAGLLMGLLTLAFVLVPQLWLGTITQSHPLSANLVMSLIFNLLKISVFASVFGSLFDSWLGAVFEYSGENKKTGKVTNCRGPDVVEITDSFEMLTGNQVNFLSATVTAFFVPLVIGAV